MLRNSDAGRPVEGLGSDERLVAELEGKLLEEQGLTAELDSENVKLMSELESERRLVKELERDVRSRENDAELLVNSRKTMYRQISELKSEQGALKNEKELVQKKCNSQDAVLEKLRLELGESNKDCELLGDENLRLKNQLEELRETGFDAEEESSGLRRELATAKQQLALAKQHLADEKTKNEQLVVAAPVEILTIEGLGT